MTVGIKKGQNLTELALIIGVVGLVFIGMEIYAKRGLQGKVKDLTDNMIGKEQSVYLQDTSGLEVNTSESKFIILPGDSTTTVQERIGGQKQVIAHELSTTTYTYESEDSLAK
ncbi:MAG: hypothetical protein COT38_01060 [Candidatus Omnitrophica bacterium CG08_land_8_20_14_0_20_41_16]|nr:MAG: hypothetical protein COT38_01060 [Candidatus Omnitrophica bacterium CG08_land_8_20_14_0_20_41_16]